MDLIGMAGVPDHRHCFSAANGGSAHVCPALCPVHAGRYCRRRDLDAPDLGTASKAGMELPQAGYQTQSDGHGGLAKRPRRDGGKFPAASARPVLAPDQSAILRERLVAELLAINSADEAAAWAHRNFPAKNSLTAEDAQIVEAQFKARLSTISDGVTAEEPLNAGPNEGVVSAAPLATDTRQKTSAAARALGKTVRLRDKDHRKFLTRQPCLVCGRVPSDSHHLTFAQPRALGNRVSDEFTVPVCRIHHRELHRSGDEAAWWQKLNIDPVSVALRLWEHRQADVAPVPIREGVTQAQAAKTPEISVQDRADTSSGLG